MVARGSQNGLLGLEREKRKRKEKIMLFLVATNGVASRPPERRPTGTPHAHAKKDSLAKKNARS